MTNEFNIEEVYAAVEEAGAQFETSYGNLEDVLEDHGVLTDGVEEYLEGQHDSIAEQLGKFQTNLIQAAQALESGGEASGDEVVEQLEKAGQNLANAYHETIVTWNKSEGVLYNGEKALDSSVNMVDNGDDVDYDEFKGTLEGKEDAFAKYDDILGEAADAYSSLVAEEGVETNIDIGLEHQEPYSDEVIENA